MDNTDNIDYTELYSKYLMCKNCNRKTNGIEDFKNSRTGKITKTCIKCRTCVLKSQAKNPKAKPITKVQQIELLVQALKIKDKKSLKKFYEQNPVIKTLVDN